MTEVIVQYERKYSDGNYGSEGLSMSWSVSYDDDDNFYASDPPVVNGRCAVIAAAIREAVLSQLAKSAASQVARAAQRELNPPLPRQAVTAGAAPDDLEDLPY